MSEQEIARLKRRLERERNARKAAERIAEEKTRQLYETNGELQHTLSYLTAILDNMADCLIVLDNNLRVKMVNHAALQTFERTEVETIGLSCREAFGPPLAEQVEPSASAQPGEPGRQFELTLPHKRIGMALVSPIFAEGQPEHRIGYVALIRDFTAAKEIDRMKTEFISNVSHELRTPLTSILGFTKIIRRKLKRTLLPTLEQIESPKVQKATKQVKGNIEIIISEGERLTKLINEVLDVAKMEAGKMDWQMDPLDLEPWVDRVFASASSLFEGRDVALVKEIEPGLPTIVGDQDRLIQVLLNLISNAAKFTDEGAVTCRVRLTDERDAVLVSVQDSGVGIKDDDLDKVFEKFKQVGDTLTDKPHGTGLGLPICKQIVTHHKGRIWVESEYGVGSTFSFTLPLDPEQVAQLQRAAEPDELRLDAHVLLEQLNRRAPGHGSGARTVLVVDDEPNIREFLRQELQPAGFIVEEARDGLEAVSKAKELGPDLIILDVMMPTMNGFDAAAVLKNDPRTMSIPIIIHSIIEDRERSYRIGIDRYLAKPIATNVLLNEIHSLLGQRAQRTILLVADEPDTAQALSSALQGTASENTVEVTRGEDCVQRALELEPDMIIVDASVPEHNNVIQTLKGHKALEGASLILLADRQLDEESLKAITNGS